jgi:hypothetical protein
MLLQETVGEDDFKWLKAFDIPIKIDRPSHTFDVSTGVSKTIYGKTTIILDTTTDKQRDMLVLKYGNSIVLLSEEYVLPNSMSLCKLDRIDWHD